VVVPGVVPKLLRFCDVEKGEGIIMGGGLPCGNERCFCGVIDVWIDKAVA
jgi:hypothetical protein